MATLIHSKPAKKDFDFAKFLLLTIIFVIFFGVVVGGFIWIFNQTPPEIKTPLPISSSTSANFK